MNVVASGDYAGKAVVFIGIKDGVGIAVNPFKRSSIIPLTSDTIENYDVVFDEPLKPSSKRTLRISVDFKDGKRSLIEIEEKFYKILMNKCFK